MKNRVSSWRELGTDKTDFELQQRIFYASKSWLREESYSLTDQIRRSFRSIGANIAESWSKRRYPAHYNP
jgi:four helix bundle protein